MDIKLIAKSLMVKTQAKQHLLTNPAQYAKDSKVIHLSRLALKLIPKLRLSDAY